MRPGYAQIANSNNKTTSQNATPDNHGTCFKKISKPRIDDRLFLHLSESDPLCKLSGYAFQTYLKAKLRSDDQLLSNILPTKKGLTLCPSKGNSSAFANKLTQSNIVDGKMVEKLSVWTSYRISSAPRKIDTIKENFEHPLVTVTASITAAIGIQSISVFPSRDNDAPPESPTKSWIVRFKNDYTPLPRVLSLFGLRTTTCNLPCRSAAT